MIAKNTVLVKIVVQGKADKGYRTISGAFKPCPCNPFEAEFDQADMGVLLNIVYIIKNEIAVKDGGVNNKGSNSKEKKA